MPSPLDLADLPFLREALVEVILLGRAGGLLERLDRAAPARLLLARRRVGDLPGPGRRGRLGLQPAARRPGGRARLRGRRGARRARRARAERGDGAAAGRRARRRRGAGQRRVRVRRRRSTGCCSAPCSALGHRRPGRCPPRPSRSWRSPRSRSAAPGRRSRSTPTARPPSACPRRAPTSCCWRSWRWRRSPRSRPWAPCWWPRSTCCPARRRGWSRARPGAAGLVGSRSRSPRALRRALRRRTGSTCRPARPWPCSARSSTRCSRWADRPPASGSA